MSAAKELFRIVGAWEQELNYFSVGLEDRASRRHLMISTVPNHPGLVTARFSNVRSGEALEYLEDFDTRPLMSPEDVRAALRWLSLGEEMP